ncbi:CDP-glycerol glycerophosphotransferase [Jeotgalicoccus aerolatus]|uniref:CDP-glycerol glycerophosphotransferase n=1 Tax=Jeotgalicoccus aerolatus TaxID=709510 RepID=A0A1G8VUV6_9STAP|nr:CDP-glycerol glycerophosphotransferase family protein [Jeotgalicoccus aerolatus]SDJ69858.1 CDP-glycerol glycerophosphotransferase [Jeotgalicoccus aerolatus]
MRKIKKLALKLYKILFWLSGKSFNKDHSLIIFESFLGKQFSDNPRALYEYMSIHYPEYRFMWSVDKRYEKVFERYDLPYIRRFSLSWMIYMNKATLWISNSRLPLWIPKPKGTTYLQTWHGTPLKKLATDMDEVHMPGTDTERYKRNFTRESAKWDFLISPNEYSTEIFKKAFKFDDKMLETGYPRNDFLFTNSDEEAVNNLKKDLNLPADKKIILYAPTWRDDSFHGKGRYKFNLEFNMQQMYEALSDEYIIILRLHYLVSENLDISGYEGFIYDYSSYEEIRDLYVISDMLITDYSSVFFDYANLERPMIFYTYDIDNYRDKLRGFYFDFENKAPGPLVKTTDALLEEINKTKTENFNELYNTAEFRNRFCSLEDGKASQRVADEVICYLRSKIV